MSPRKARSTKPIDVAAVASALTGRADARTWVSVGTVSYDEGAVKIDPELGPLVDVVLQPDKVVVACRVLGAVAGKGEGDYFPFVAGDEVVVTLPEGSTRACPIIMGRLNNGKDLFPKTCAGQDTTKNAVAFRRQRPPQLLESASAMVARHSTTGAMASIDADGNVTIRDGSSNVVQLSADTVTVQSGDAKMLLQFDLKGGRGTLQVGDAILTLASSSAKQQKSAVVVPGVLSISTLAQPAAEHVATAESVANLLTFALVAGLAAAVPPAVLAPDLAATAVAAAITAAGVAPLHPTVAAALVAAFAAATQKPPPTPTLGQSQPGPGCAGLRVG